MTDESDTDSNSSSPPSPIDDRLSHLARRLASVDRVLLCLDFDGTLAPHVDDPASAELTSENQRVLETLDQQAALDIAIVSGRALSDVKDRVGIDDFRYAGNHGLEIDRGTGNRESTAYPPVNQYRSSIQTVCAELETQLDIPGCEVENKGVTATVHYRNANIDSPDVIEERVASVVDESGAEDLQLVPGTEIIEIRPAIDWNKGHAVRQFEEWYRDERGGAGEHLTIYIGDDTTDEDAFRAIESEGISIYVGTDGETTATYCVPDVDGVTGFLVWLAETGIDGVEQNTNDDQM
jgi:trehalose 6-phosphate phosphatase